MTNQQLKAHCEDVIANPQDHSEMVLAMATALLPCLEAEPEYVRHSCDCCGHDSLNDFHACPKCNFDRVSKDRLYTSPPVSVMQPVVLPKPELSSAKGVLLYADDVIAAINAAGYECEVKS